MEHLQVIEIKGIRVLTSAQIAACYETTRDCIKKNFHLNKGRFIEGKHYIVLIGDELKKFKNKVTNSNLVLNYGSNEVGKNDLVGNMPQNEVTKSHFVAEKVKYQFDTQFKYAKSLYLWTEKGALLHAKSLNTDKAWEIYDYLVDFYFRAKEKEEPIKAVAPTNDVACKSIQEAKPPMRLVVNVPDDPKAQDMIREIKKALNAVEVMLDESNRYVSDDIFKERRMGMANAFQALMCRITMYLDLKPKMIQKVY